MSVANESGAEGEAVPPPEGLEKRAKLADGRAVGESHPQASTRSSDQQAPPYLLLSLAEPRGKHGKQEDKAPPHLTTVLYSVFSVLSIVRQISEELSSQMAPHGASLRGRDQLSALSRGLARLRSYAPTLAGELGYGYSPSWRLAQLTPAVSRFCGKATLRSEWSLASLDALAAYAACSTSPTLLTLCVDTFPF